MKNKLRQLVIKPTLKCNSMCPTCSLRLNLFEHKKNENALSLYQWREVLIQAADLGCKDLHISGGEPLLYDKLTDLIAIGTDKRLSVNLNTNGSLINNENAKILKSVRLTSATVSIYSHNPAIHDEQRGYSGLYGRAITAIDALVKNDIPVYLQTILTNYNIDEFHNIVALAYYHQVNHMLISYLEGDIYGEWLPTIKQIENFKKNVIPLIYDIIDRESGPDGNAVAKSKLSKVFTGDARKVANFSKGEYLLAGRPHCSRPHSFALILSNGDVLPCNGVEYCHTPIIGNVNNHDLAELWDCDAWSVFRKERHDWCRLCPMTLHFNFPILGVSQ